jgi:hypothetical protein
MLADPNPHETAVLRTTYSCGLLVRLAVAEPLADLLPDGWLTVIPRAPHATIYSLADELSPRSCSRPSPISAPLAPLLQGTSECLAAREHGLEQVAVLFDPLERLAHPEAARCHVLC